MHLPLQSYTIGLSLSIFIFIPDISTRKGFWVSKFEETGRQVFEKQSNNA